MCVLEIFKNISEIFEIDRKLIEYIKNKMLNFYYVCI